jgi:hypothetical protein
MTVFTRYRILAGLLTAALPALAFTCGVCDECMQPCEQVRVGSLGLHPASGSWLPATPPDSVRFVNSNGFRATLHRAARVETPADSVAQTGYAGRQELYQLVTDQSIYDCGPYFRTQRRRLRYEGRNLPFTLDYALVRDLSGSYPGLTLLPEQELLRTVADTLPDAVVVGFNDHTFARFPVVRRPYRQPFQNTRFLDSAVVAGRTFFGVYQQTVPASPNANPATVRLRSLYFQPGQGVVGFIYTNNEQWARF